MVPEESSKKKVQSKRAVFDWTFFRLDYLVLLIVSRVEFIVFALFLEAVGVREYCCMAVENRLAVLCSARASRAREELSSKRVGAVGLSRKPPKLRSWRYTQPRAAKAAAGVAVVGKMTPVSRTAVVV